MNILEYIEDLMAQGYSEEDASICADCMFSDSWDSGEDDYYEEDYYDEWEDEDYGPSNPWDAPGMQVSDFIRGVR